MKCYAYQVEVRDKPDTEWKHLEIMVSPPGHAPRQVLNSVRDGKGDLVRVTRIRESTVFLDRLSQGYVLGVREGFERTEVEFDDAILAPGHGEL